MKAILKLIVLMSGFCFAQTHPDYKWRTINTGFTENIKRITFSDSLHGWAISDSNIICTTDGGESWNKQMIPVSAPGLMKVFFTSNNTGYTVGNRGLILATKDGGKNWIKQNSGDNEHQLRGISFCDDSTGWVAGEMDNGTKRGGLLLRTTNGGAKWDTLSDRSDGYLYRDVKFQDKNNGVIIASIGFDNFDPTEVYNTSDGGKTLNHVNTIKGYFGLDLYLAGKDTLWSGGFGFVRLIEQGNLYNRDWNVELPDTTIYLLRVMDLLPLDGQYGYGVISDIRGANNTTIRLYYTDTYGVYWNIVPTPEGFQPTAVSMAGKYLFVPGYKSPMITNKPKAVEVYKEKITVNSFDLRQNYPNPFNPSTTIEYYIEDESSVSLRIFNVLGKEIKCVVDERKSPGWYVAQWNGEDNNNTQVSSGIYFFSLKVDGRSKMKKALLLR